MTKIRKALTKAYATILDMLARIISRSTGVLIPLGTDNPSDVSPRNTDESTQ